MFYRVTHRKLIMKDKLSCIFTMNYSISRDYYVGKTTDLQLLFKRMTPSGVRFLPKDLSALIYRNGFNADYRFDPKIRCKSEDLNYYYRRTLIRYDKSIVPEIREDIDINFTYPLDGFQMGKLSEMCYYLNLGRKSAIELLKISNKL